MRLITIGVAIAIAALSTVPATAQQRQSSGRLTLCGKAYGVRHAVVRRYGRRAPGRDICRQGVRRHHRVRPATSHEKARYLRALRRLIRASHHVYVAGYAGPPRRPPAGTMSVSYRPVGVAACIVSRESGGNPRAVNGQYHGIAQWSAEAWSRMGGRRYAADPINATYQQQLQVLDYGLSHYGTGDWGPYDGC